MSNVYYVAICHECRKPTVVENTIVAHGGENLQRALDLLHDGQDVYFCQYCGMVYDSDRECRCDVSDVIKFERD